MEEITIPKPTLDKLEEVLEEDEFIQSNDLGQNDPVTQILIVNMHQKEVIEFQNQIINDMRRKQLLTIDHLKKLDESNFRQHISDLVQQLEKDLYQEGEGDEENLSPESKNKENKEGDKSQDNYKAIQEYHDVDNSYLHSNSSPSAMKNNTSMSKSRGVDSKIQLDQVLAKIVNGDEELNETHLLENPDKGYIDAMKDPITHTYTYREMSNILRDQQHTITDYMYKLFLVSINFAKMRQTKSYTVFKALLSRVRLNACEVLLSSCLSCFKMRAFLSYLELSANMEEDSLVSDHIPEKLKKRLTTNNLRYQNYDPAYEKPPGIIGDENDDDLNHFAINTLRKIEINKPEVGSDVPRYIYRILSVLYTCYNKQNGTKISTGVIKSIMKCETRICRALVLYTQGKRSKTSLNDMIKELEHVEFAKNLNKRFFR